jgi:hypothetical protein
MNEGEEVPGKQYVFPIIIFSITYLHLLLLYEHILLIIWQCSAPKGSPQENHGSWLREADKKGNRLPIQVAEGKKRPDVPLQAAKLASETGVALRDNLPIYTSWKLYEKDAAKEEVQKVLDKVAVRWQFHSKYLFALLALLPCKKLCLRIHLCGCSQGWMWMLRTRDQANLHALILSRRE